MMGSGPPLPFVARKELVRLANGALGAGPPLCTAAGNELVKFIGSPHPALRSSSWNELIRSAN